MDRDEAVSRAQLEAAQTGFPYLVYRFPAWPEGVYGVLRERPLPVEAIVTDTVTPGDAQGSLF